MYDHLIIGLILDVVAVILSAIVLLLKALLIGQCEVISINVGIVVIESYPRCYFFVTFIH